MENKYLHVNVNRRDGVCQIKGYSFALMTYRNTKGIDTML